MVARHQMRQLVSKLSIPVVVDGDGALVLHSETDQRFDAWIANSRAGRVNRLPLLRVRHSPAGRNRPSQ